jgi:hypothetical protein
VNSPLHQIGLSVQRFGFVDVAVMERGLSDVPQNLWAVLAEAVMHQFPNENGPQQLLGRTQAIRQDCALAR